MLTSEGTGGMPDPRECMLCCGIGGGFSPYSAHNPFKLAPSTIKTMIMAKRSGADAVVTYCSGCLQMFESGRLFYRTAQPVYHILELVSMALGERDRPEAPFHQTIRAAGYRYRPLELTVRLFGVAG
jgi:hypothetical protein